MSRVLRKVFVVALLLILILSIPLVVGTNHNTSAQGSGSGNGKIVFSRALDNNWEIYVVDEDGTNLTRLTNHPAWDYSPDWSPDGTKIAFNSHRDGNGEIYVMNADGSNPVNLTNNRFGHDMFARWSPDGTQIAFSSTRDGRYDIYVMNADGSNVRRLTNDPEADSGPAWSPDGTQIAFVSNRDSDYEIYVMKADGSNLTRLTTYVGEDRYPTWSPDGRQIMFIRSGDIYVMNTNGSNVSRLTTTNGVWNNFANWSPDGTQIVFSSNLDGNIGVYVMNVDGSNLRLLTSAVYDEYPDWYDSSNTSNTSGCRASVPEAAYQGDTFTLIVDCEDISDSIFGFQVGHTVTAGASLVSTQATGYTAGTIFQGQQTLAGPNTLPLYALSLQAGGIQATGDFTLGSVEYVAVAPGQVTFDIMDLILGDIDGNAISNPAASTTAATITISDLILSLMGTIDPQGYAHVNQLTFTLDGSPVYANLTSTYNATTGNTAFTYTNIKGQPASLTVDAPSHVACVESLTFPIDAGNETLPGTLILRAGDVNGDNRVNITDAAAIGQGYGLQPTGELDINHDGAVNILDLIHVGRNYGIAQATDCTP